ncbi:helix-turn-helix domain-containing protein [Aquimarina sp. I32.4]|uniref:helix-turn-helix domain-containing protein n=1 Tax=Aquimarina sp. I32.4 TaxID=2053903 RepID=UPI0011AED022|nr:helix-turn-helix transcriptional regulator [Aquimarina sp. I32.4]
MDKTDFTEQHKAIGKRIKELRIKAGYSSYKKFAIEHNFEMKSIWRWEAGTNYKLDTLLKIAEIHGITVSELLKDIK